MATDRRVGKSKAGRTRRSWLMVALLGAAGCSGGAAPPQPATAPVTAPSSGAAEPAPAASEGPRVEVGTSTIRDNRFVFIPLATGDSVDMVAGPQGGYHIWGSVRVQYMDPKDALIVFSVRRADNQETVSFNEVPPLTLQWDGQAYAYNGIFGVLCQQPSECPAVVNSLIDQQVVLKMNVRDRQGKSAEDVRTVVARGSPLPSR